MNPLALFTMLPLRDWLAIAAVIFGLTLMGIGAHHERDIGRREVQAKWDAERSRQQAVAAKAEADNQAESARLAQADKENRDEAQRLATRARDDADDARSAGDRMLQRAIASGGRPAAADPAAPAGSSPTADAALVPADLLRRAVEAAEQLADLADRRGIAGQACERAFDALKGPETPASAPGGP